MILAKTLTIHEFRGIRDLTLDLGCANFAVCGPNGTGKSGIVDAHGIQPFYAGLLARTSGLSVSIEADGDAIVVAARAMPAA